MMLWSFHLYCTFTGILFSVQTALSGHKEHFLEALVDGSAKMPCNVVPKKDDSVEFIFWYKNDDVTPIYTLDARRRPLSQATHVKNETYSNRVHFHVAGKVPHLQLDFLGERDMASYVCRVDYQWSATEVTKVHLMVVVPPKHLIIRDDAGREIYDIAGPYREKTDITLSCEAQKGYPDPNVTWWRDDKLIDNTFQKYSNGVVNDMKLNNLSRLDLSASFHCKAQNTKLASPIVKTVILDMYLYPVTVHIMRLPGLSAGREVQLICESIGSRPAATVTWMLNGSLLTDHRETVHGNATHSVLTFLPKPVHHGSKVSCRAENPKMYVSLLEDTKVLNVTYIPQVSLRLLKEEEDRQPKEDDYVRLICDVNANPSVLKVGWTFNDLPLVHNNITGIGNILVFKRLSRTDRGRYRCYGVNEEGRGLSEEFILNISYAPVCKANQQITYPVALNQSAVVRCEVEAHPPDVTFRWEFSNAVRKHYDLRHTTHGTVSLAEYRPSTNADYGTLFCWANNSVGQQLSSCFFTVIAPACKSENTKVNASSLSRDGSKTAWHYSAITAVAVISFSIIVVTSACVFYFRRIYLEKKHRPIPPMLEEQVNIYNSVHCHNSEQQFHILITK